MSVLGHPRYRHGRGFRYSLAHDADACEYYDSIISTAKKCDMQNMWKQLCELFASRFSSVTKKTEISACLESLMLEDVLKKGGDDCAAAGKIKKRIN